MKPAEEPAAAIEILAPARYDDARSLLARAFEDDPGYVYTFPDGRRRAAQLAWVYTRIVRANARFGATFALAGAGEAAPLLAVSSWLPPGAFLGAIDMIREGMILAPLSLGLRETKRIFDTLGAMDAERARLLGGTPHWYLDQLAVALERQGEGHGRRMLTQAIERCRAAREAPMLLFTAKERNLPFYTGSGFEVKRELRIGGEGGYRLWSMLRSQV